ncbi:phosphate ABC transporter substrate-binding protein PstS [Arthrobacter halodurans]|uniref:Phosphate-binding protein n=1 Tax=Arthrobacter halodurans TaxID=516699 RepID=A0ABV4UKU1_9MICC
MHPPRPRLAPSARRAAAARAAGVRRTRRAAAATLAVGALLLSACGSDYPLGEEQRRAAEANTSDLSGTITGVGSSAQSAAMATWISQFSSLNPDVRVQYSPAGSGAGRTAFLAGGVAFAGSDAFLDDDELADAEAACGPGGAINIPAYISPIALAFNLPGISEIDLDAETVARIFRGEITNWSDPAIARLNEGVDLPDLGLTAIHRADDSGTTENFTEYLHAAAPGAWMDEADGSWPSDLGGENAQGNAGVMSTVTRTVGAITYADDSVVGAASGKARLAVGDQFVAVSPEAAARAVESSTRVPDRGGHDIALHLDRTTTAEGAYPLVLVSYQIYCTGYRDAQTVELVKAFGGFVVSPEGQELAADSVGSSPMPAGLAGDAAAAIESITTR